MKIQLALALELIEFLGRFDFDDDLPPSDINNRGYLLKEELKKQLCAQDYEILFIPKE